MRYYLLKIEETLFGEFLLERVYGSMSHKKPTRVLKEYYDSWVEAKKMFDFIINKVIEEFYKSDKMKKLLDI